MFSVNSVDPDEIRLLHQKLNPGFTLLLRHISIHLDDIRASIIIRALNKARHLEALLQSICHQQSDCWHEVILVDSGSTDGTLQIAARHGCLIMHISRQEFSF